MISVVIITLDEEEKLLRTLVALAPASAEGIVADVVVADRGSRDATLAVADAAGCAIVEGCADRRDAIARAVAAARKSWLLLLLPGDLPGEDALEAARNHVWREEQEGGLRAAAFLAPPSGAGLPRKAVLGWCFAAGGWSSPHHRRVLAPRAAAHLLGAAGRRWAGARLAPRVDRLP